MFNKNFKFGSLVALELHYGLLVKKRIYPEENIQEILFRNFKSWPDEDNTI